GGPPPALDRSAAMAGFFNPPPANPESKCRLIVGLDVPGQHDSFGRLSSGGCDRSDRTHLGGLNLSARFARRKNESKANQDQASPWRTMSAHCKFLTGSLLSFAMCVRVACMIHAGRRPKKSKFSERL